MSQFQRRPEFVDAERFDPGLQYVRGEWIEGVVWRDGIGYRFTDEAGWDYQIKEGDWVITPDRVVGFNLPARFVLSDEQFRERYIPFHVWGEVTDDMPREEGGVCLRCGKYANSEALEECK